MIKHESKFHTKLMTWLRYNHHRFPKSFLFESKVVRPGTNRFPLKELTEKERLLLTLAKKKQIIQTHSDFDRTGTNCDGAVISGGGYIFLHWCRRANKEFYAIDIDELMEFIKSSKVKSITESQAALIGTKYKLA